MTKKQTKTVSFTVKFPRSHEFEGQTYTELDLSGLEDLTEADLAQCEREFIRMGFVDTTKEFNSRYCILIAQKATCKPIEFFTSLKLPNVIALKGVISAFLFQSLG